MLAHAAAVVALVVLAGVPAAAASAQNGAGGSSSPRLAPSFLKGVQPEFGSIGPQGAGLKGRPSPTGIGAPYISSIENWTQAAPDAPGFSFWDTVGTSPSTNGTTSFNAPVVPVVVSLRNPDGSQAYDNGQPLISSPSQYVLPTLESPVFSKTTYSSSSIPTQFTDAVQRAEYWGQEQKNWHTELSPTVKAPLQMNIPYGDYYYALNSDGTCCSYILVDYNEFGALMFPPTYPVDNTTVMGQAELNGDVNTKSISTFLFPNTFLYENGDPNDCCVLGYHTFDYEPGAQSSGGVPRAYVMNWASWISPGLFGPSFTDVTGLSHELSEIFNDPFVGAFGDNQTPWYAAPNGYVCQNVRETGDVIEGLPNATYPITMNGFTYHPQNEALLPWFEFAQHSTAIDGAYSYPDESVLPGPPTPQNPGCS